MGRSNSGDGGLQHRVYIIIQHAGLGLAYLGCVKVRVESGINLVKKHVAKNQCRHTRPGWGRLVQRPQGVDRQTAHLIGSECVSEQYSSARAIPIHPTT